MIDLANQHAAKFDYWENGELVESFFLFSLDDKIKEKVKAEYEKYGFTQKILHLIEQDVLYSDRLQQALHPCISKYYFAL